MGIKGLLQVIKPAMQVEYLQNFKGKRIAVDGYAWLHKAAYGCCVELCRGEKPTAWMRYFISLVDLLLNYDIVVTLVFDGSALPMKAGTETDRENSRQSNLKKAEEYARNGDHTTARMYYSRAVDITPRMAAEVIQVIRRTRPSVHVIVSPFEADAQLSYLCLHNLVDMVISEDSDTIPYGCKDIIFKLERDGSCQRLLLSDLQTQIIDKFDLRAFDADMILAMCILSGCDYLDSIKGMGLKTAYKMIIKHRTAENTLKTLRVAGQLPIIPCIHHPGVDLLQYELDFYNAMMTFAHQVIFDPITRTTKHRVSITPASFPPSVLPIYWCEENNCLKSELVFLGTLIEDTAIACGIADGLVDPITKLPFNLPDIIERSISSSNGSNNRNNNNSRGEKGKTSNNHNHSNNGFKRAVTSSTSSSISYFKQGNKVEGLGSISSHFNKLTEPSAMSRDTSWTSNTSSSQTSSSSSATVSFFQANAGSTSAAVNSKIGNNINGKANSSNTSSRVSIIQALRNGTYRPQATASSLSVSSAADGTVTPSSSNGKSSQSSSQQQQTPMTNERVSRYFSALGDTDEYISDEVKAMPSLSSLVSKSTVMEVIEIDLDDNDNDGQNDNIIDVYQAVEVEEVSITLETTDPVQKNAEEDPNNAEDEDEVSDKMHVKRKLQSYQYSTKVGIFFLIINY